MANMKACRSSVPAEGVLSRNGMGNVGRPSRAGSAVVAVANSRATVAGHVAAHQSATHERRASVAGKLHVGRTLAAANGAGAAMGLLLALVATGNDEHGTAVQSTKADGTDRDTGGGGLLLGALTVRAAGTKGIVVGGARGRRSTTATAAVAVSAVVGATVGELAKDVDLGVDQSRQVADNGVRVVVDERVGHRHVQLELVNQVLGVVDLGESGDITPLGAGVVGDKLGDLDLLHVDAGGGGEGLRQILEDLSGGNSVAGDEHVVERVQESNLDRDSALRSGRVGVIGVDDLGDIGWQRR